VGQEGFFVKIRGKGGKKTSRDGTTPAIVRGRSWGATPGIHPQGGKVGKSLLGKSTVQE